MAIEQPDPGKGEAGNQGDRGSEMADRPEERHAAQESQEQRRAERRERAAGVAHQQDEGQHQVESPPPVGVGAQQRMDQQHRGGGGADHPRRQGAKGEQRHVAARRAAAQPAQHHPAAGGVEGRDQGDEGQVVGQNAVPGAGGGCGGSQQQGTWDQQRQRPQDGDARVVALPPSGRGQRDQREAEHQPGERQAPEQRGARLHGGDGASKRRARKDRAGRRPPAWT